ncbi:MAG: histidine triad (HIT) family protein [Cyclobacteriaceae bacterium]|jgi:histidine triad (HIT) family protein
MATIFSKIIDREIPAYIVAENDDHIAFLDINPLKEGHTLVVPKVEVDYIYDLEDDQLTSLHIFAKKVANAIGKAIPCERIGVTVIGLEVPHAHIHLIPIDGVFDMNFQNPKLKFSSEEFTETVLKIKSKF